MKSLPDYPQIPPGLEGQPVTVYMWHASSLPCPACIALKSTKSLVRRPRPHLFCRCPGDIALGFTDSSCRFVNREVLNEEVQEERVLDHRIPAGGSYESEHENALDGNVKLSGDIKGISIESGGSGSTKSKQKSTLGNDGDKNKNIYRVYQLTAISGVDTVECDLGIFGSSTYNIPFEDYERRFIGFEAEDIN